MRVHTFFANGHWAYTQDESGSNLPEAPWQRFKIIHLTPERDEEPMNVIAEQGYCVKEGADASRT